MSDTPENRKTSLTLEQLLHVKRAERPAPAFWEEFDRELRRRQLAAIVVVQPWYARLGRFVLTATRRTAPAGAAALAVFAAFLAFHRNQQPQAQPVQLAQIEPEVAPAIAVPEEQTSPSAAVAVQEEPTVMTPAALEGETHYASQEFISAVKPTRYVNLTAPRMVSMGGQSEVYVVNTLTSGAAFRGTAQQAAGSF